MNTNQILILIGTLLFGLLHIGFVARAILRPHREPASRFAWVVVIVVLPVIGILAYILVGETNIGRYRTIKLRRVLADLPAMKIPDEATQVAFSSANAAKYAHLFHLGHSINGFYPVSGNQAQLMHDSNAAIDAIVADIDAAIEHVHLIFYIWLPDHNGLKIVDALLRAAARKVACRAMVDGLGSRTMIASKYWASMRANGVQVATALPIGNPLLRVVRGRIDLRNHRKIVIIDRHITYCGSQNCADPEFLIKASFAPWVDALIRFDGPIAWQNQHLFASDWMAQVDEDITRYLQQPVPRHDHGLVAQVIGTGPTARHSAMPEVFATLMFAARRELFITTPYYVPDEAMQAALCATALRGVATTIIFPARNDSWIVGAASRSYYADLLAAGVRIFEYQGGLLHTKSLTVDGDITLIGSANMDRRSFELNYENNILFYDTTLTAAVRERQASYLARSSEVTPDQVSQWSVGRRLLNNGVAMFGPIL